MPNESTFHERLFNTILGTLNPAYHHTLIRDNSGNVDFTKQVDKQTAIEIGESLAETTLSIMEGIINVRRREQEAAKSAKAD